jgi:hypothetical protein
MIESNRYDLGRAQMACLSQPNADQVEGVQISATVLGMALLTLLERMPRSRWARHWPLGLVLLAVAIVARAQ